MPSQKKSQRCLINKQSNFNTNYQDNHSNQKTGQIDNSKLKPTEDIQDIQSCQKVQHESFHFSQQGENLKEVQNFSESWCFDFDNFNSRFDVSRQEIGFLVSPDSKEQIDQMRNSNLSKTRSISKNPEEIHESFNSPQSQNSSDESEDVIEVLNPFENNKKSNSRSFKKLKKQQKKKRRNAPQNFKNSILKYILEQKNSKQIKQILEFIKSPVKYSNLLDFATKWKKKKTTSIEVFHSLWLDQQYGSEMRVISNHFLMHKSIPWIFSNTTRLGDKIGPLANRNKLLEGLKKPENFNTFS